MSFEEYLKKFKKVQKKIINFLEEEEEVDVHFENLKRKLIDIKIQNNFFDNKMILRLISALSNNYKRRSDFFNKIEKIIMIFKDEIKNLSNQEIFNIFSRNKRILLFLIEQNLFVISEEIFRIMIKYKNSNFNYIRFFGPELKSYIEHKHQTSKKNYIKIRYKHFLEEISNQNQEDFYEKRKKGENDEYICQLIQNDSIVDFIVYVNKTNISLNSIIPRSIFETNLFLFENFNKTSLIEYAAFCGSLQIFKYLILNNAEIMPSIWLYAIHGANNDLIHCLEENEIKPNDTSFQQCYKEAIKCHHNPIAEYINNNLLECENSFLEQYLKYYNFSFIKNIEINNDTFVDLCQYDYYYFFEIFLESKLININYESYKQKSNEKGKKNDCLNIENIKKQL